MLSVGGIELLPQLRTFLAFVAAGLALNIVPGADMTFVIASAARGDKRDGVIAAMGIGAGTLFHISAAVLGLSAILASSETLFAIIKWVGAGYLLYIAVSLILSGKTEGPAAPRQSGWRLFRAAAEHRPALRLMPLGDSEAQGQCAHRCCCEPAGCAADPAYMTEAIGRSGGDDCNDNVHDRADQIEP